MKNALTKMKNTLETINSRLDEPMARIRDLEDKVEKNTQSEQQNNNNED